MVPKRAPPLVSTKVVSLGYIATALNRWRAIIAMMSQDRVLPLGVRYDSRAHDLARYQEDPLDDVLADFVAHMALIDTGPRMQTIANLDEESDYALMAFAKRRALKALRDNAPSLAESAVSALTLVDRSHVDFRDLSVDFPLLVARMLGLDAEGLARHSAELSVMPTAEVFLSALPRISELALSDCMYVEVHSHYGLGLMENWTKDYDSSSGVAELVIRVADEVDAEGAYWTSRFKIDELPGVWFSQESGAEDVPTVGSASLHANHETTAQSLSHGLLVFLAAMPTEPSAQRWASAANTSSTKDRPRIAIHSGARLALIIGGSATVGEVPLETQDSLGRFVELITPIL